MTDVPKTRYDEMKGPELTAELTRRQLPTTGKVDELRARLREDDEARLDAQVTPDTAVNEADAARIQAEKTLENNPQARPDIPDGAPEGQDTGDRPDEAHEAEETRDPIRYEFMGVRLNERQARALTLGEAQVARFTKHVNPVRARKYVAGDQVVGIGDWENRVCRVLPLGVEIELEDDEDSTDGLDRLRKADAKVSRQKDED